MKFVVIDATFISECCMCAKLELLSMGKNMVYFHAEDERMGDTAKSYLKMLLKIKPDLSPPNQTVCICVECLDSVEQKYLQVIKQLLFMQFNQFYADRGRSHVT